MGTRKETEVVGGIVETPMETEIIIQMPPEKSGRKDIVEGELVVSKVSVTPEKLAKRVADAKKKGITEIPPQVSERTTDEGR